MRIEEAALLDVVKRTLIADSNNAEEAGIIARHLVDADLTGHGIAVGESLRVRFIAAMQKKELQ